MPPAWMLSAVLTFTCLAGASRLHAETPLPSRKFDALSRLSIELVIMFPSRKR